MKRGHNKTPAGRREQAQSKRAYPNGEMQAGGNKLLSSFHLLHHQGEATLSGGKRFLGLETLRTHMPPDHVFPGVIQHEPRITTFVADGYSSGSSGKRYEIRAPSTDGGLSNAAVSPTGGDRRELPAVALAWPAESGTNTDAIPTGARMGLGIATIM